jgi:transposase
MPTLDLTLEPEPVEIRRFEVITGVGGRRTWPAEAKARILAEALAPGANVSAVARRHGLRPQQIFTWRREARRADASAALAFAPVVVDEPAAVPPRKPRRRRPTVAPRAAVELEIGGVVVRVGPGADARTLAMVVRALKRSA